MDAAPPQAPPGYTGAAKVLVNTVIVVLLGLMACGVLIKHKYQNPVLTAAQPVVTATGTQQLWAVFAPPRGSTIYVDVRTAFADGTSSTWRVPTHLGLWDQRDYHWKQWGEYIRAKEHEGDRDAFARYLADRERARVPVHVTMTTTWSNQNPPGEDPPHGTWHTDTFYDKPVTP